MDDLEMTRLCAKSWGLHVRTVRAGVCLERPDWEPDYGYDGVYLYDEGSNMWRTTYNPIWNDAQAMALVKKFKLTCSWHAQPPDEVWEVTTPYAPVRGASTDLNRAVVQCVAKIT